MIHLIEFRAMGCQVSVQLEADKQGADILRMLPQRFANIEATLTRFDSHSELMRFNAHAGEWVAVSDLLFANIQSAKHAARLTDGLYNPLILSALVANGYDRSFEQINTSDTSATNPVSQWCDIALNRKTQEVRIPAESAIDLGGVAKGWTATYIADELAEIGACLVNIGGDMVARGRPSGFTGWLVEIDDPFTDYAFTTIYLSDSSISTSGIDYRRWSTTDSKERHHIIDPRTGDSATTNVLSATIMHPSAITSEAYAKALILRGAEDGLAWLNQQWNAIGIVFHQDGAVLSTSNFTHERNIQA